MDVRCVILTKTGRFYITRSRPTEAPEGYATATLDGGGTVSIPRENVEAVETYFDGEIEGRFQRRLEELDENR